MDKSIISILSTRFRKQGAEKAVERFKEAEARYFQGDYESCLLKFGKLAEIIKEEFVRMTDAEASWPRSVDFKVFCDGMEGLPGNRYEESVRKYIPRELRNVYDLRSGRGIAHEGNIDPNLLDASVSYGMSTWVLAELVRLFGRKAPAEAKRIVNQLYERKIPFVEEIEKGDFRILVPDLSKKEEVLLLLYFQGKNWIKNQELIKWIDPADSRLVTNELPRLHKQRFIIYRYRKSLITQRGKAFVEGKLWPKLKSKLTLS